MGYLYAHDAPSACAGVDAVEPFSRAPTTAVEPLSPTMPSLAVSVTKRGIDGDVLSWQGAFEDGHSSRSPRGILRVTIFDDFDVNQDGSGRF